MSEITYKIAVIPGDGIGVEVMPEGLRVLDAAAERFGFTLDYTVIEWASCTYYTTHGQMMPDDWKEQLAGIDAIYFGAVGWPDTVPDHISLWGSLLRMRREFDHNPRHYLRFVARAHHRVSEGSLRCQRLPSRSGIHPRPASTASAGT